MQVLMRAKELKEYLLKGNKLEFDFYSVYDTSLKHITHQILRSN